jgi:hypothetical protein
MSGDLLYFSDLQGAIFGPDMNAIEGRGPEGVQRGATRILWAPTDPEAANSVRQKHSPKL